MQSDNGNLTKELDRIKADYEKQVEEQTKQVKAMEDEMQQKNDELSELNFKVSLRSMDDVGGQ